MKISTSYTRFKVTGAVRSLYALRGVSKFETRTLSVNPTPRGGGGSDFSAKFYVFYWVKTIYYRIEHRGRRRSKLRVKLHGLKNERFKSF